MPYSAKFENVYREKVNKFCQMLLKNAPPEAYRGIPKPFLPMCGKEYNFALKKIGFIGIETRGWGSLEDFLKKYNETYDFQEDRDCFQNLGFLDWGTTKRLEFWHFCLSILALAYGVQIKEISQGKYNLLIDSFVWGNCNSIETTQSKIIQKAKKDGVLGTGYQYAKKLSEDLFDHIELMDCVYEMDAVIVACKNCQHFLANGFEKLQCDSKNIKVYKKKQGKLLVFQCNHPRGSVKTGGPEQNAREIRDLLQKYSLFCPLRNVDLSEKAKEILVDKLDKLRNEKGNGAKFEAVAVVAKELHNQHSCMRASELCDLLNKSGFRNQQGGEYTGHARGPCSLVRNAYHCFKDANPGIAEDIAVSFTKKNGMYAYK